MSGVVRIGDSVTTLHEGEYAWAPPRRLHLVRVRRRGLPGTLSQLAVARQHPALRQETVVHSANLIASGGDILIRK